MNMNLSELINEIVSDWAYRVNDGMPNPKNPIHVKELEIVLNEMGLGHVKSEILQSLNEAEEGGFTNPALNKKVRYKNDKGEDKEGIVGNLLRQPEDSPGRKAAEAALPPEGSPERETMNQELGSEKDGKAKPPEDAKGKEGEDGKEGGAAAEDEKKKKAAAMFDPKADPAMGARLDREKAASDKLAQKDKEDAGKEKDSVQSQDDKLVNFINKDFNEAPDKDFEGMSDADVQSKELEARWKNADAIKEKGEDSPEAKATKAEWAKHMVEKSKRRGDMENAAMWDSIRQDNDATYKPKGNGSDVKPKEPTKADDTKPEEPTGPAGGPNAEPPANEPSKPDTTPPADVEEPKDGEEPPAPAALGDETEEETKIDKATSDLYDLLDKAESDANDIESLKKLQSQYPELFANTGLDWDKMDPDLLNQVKNTKDIRDRIKQNAAKEKTKKKTKKAASELGKRKTADGEDLDVETTDNGSMIIGVEHGEGNESTKKTIESIQQLPKDTKVMFVGEGGMSKDDNGNLELSGEQAEIRDAVKGHFDNAEEGSWDENANVLDDSSPVYDEVAKSVGGSKSKAKAAIWSNMYGQDGPDENMKPDDYLDDEGKAWLVDQAQKGGVTSITKDTDFNNLSDEQKDDLYQLNYRDDDGYGETEISKAQQEYNGFRQKELDRKVKEAEDKGFTVIAPVGNSHVDMWRQRNKPKNKPEETPTDTKPEDKPEEPAKDEPTKDDETPKATKDDIKKEKPGKEAKTDSGGSLYSVGGGYYSDKPNGPAKYVRTESVIEMAFDNSLNEDVFALFEKSITGTLQNGEKITVQELPPRAVKKATQRAKAAAATSKEEPVQPTSTQKPAEQPNAKKEFEPVAGDDVKKEIPKANPKVFGGDSDIPDGIDKKDLNKFNTDIKKVKQIVDDAKAKGEKAPDINLCDVTVAGTNLYCDGNLGIKRSAMPQFKGKPVPGSKAEKMPLNKDGEVDTEPVFKEMLKEKGITTTQTEVPADQLKATQSELGGDKVIGMMEALEKDPNHPSITAPIYVSRDGYVIDGHHRWAAIVAYNAEHPDAQIPMKCEVIDMDIKDAIPMCNDFAEEIGIAAKKQGETTGKAGDEQPKTATSMPPEAPADATPEGKSWFQRQKDRVVNGIKKWTKSEREFFDRGGHKPGSEPRRSFGQIIKDKAKGVAKAIVHGLKHEWEIFKTAGEGIVEAAANGGRLGVMKREDGTKYHWKDTVAKGPDGKYEYEEYPDYEVDSHGHAKKGPDGNYIQKVDSDGKPKTKKRPKVDPNASEEDKKLFLKSYNDSKYKQKCMMKAGKAILITGLTAAATGGLAHGIGPFLHHVAIELVPHVTLETVAIGTGKAAIFAGAAEMNMQKNLEKWGTDFMEKMADTMANKKIPIDVMAKAVEAYNKEKENTQQKSEMKIESLIKEIISEINLEAKGKKPGESKDYPGYYHRGRGYYSKQPDGEITHKSDSGSIVKLDAKEKAAKNKNQAPAPKPVGKKIAPSGFRQTPDMKKKPTKAAPKAEPTPRSETNNPNKKNGNEGETVLELKPEEIDSILEKYVNAGEKTPDEMRELTPDYSKQDMADGYSDEDYYSKNKKRTTAVRKQPYKVNEKTRLELKKAGFPEKYIKFLERCINTQVKGKKPPVTELIAQGGAGQIQSQFGEVMAMAFMSIRDPQQRRQLADIMNAEIQKSVEEFGGGKQSPIATKDWVEASLTHAEAFDSAMDEKYGKGQWKFEGAAWDIKADIESLGLDYKNKGFSTDVMLRVQPLDKNGKPNGPARAQKNSLKKDENIFFFNGSINEVNNFVLNYLDEKERKRVKGYEAIATKAGASNKNPEDRAAALAAAERITGLKGAKAVAALKQMSADIRNKAFEAAPQHVKDAVSKVRNFGAAQTASAERLIKTANTNIKNPNNVIDNAKNIDGGDKDFAKFSYKAVKECKASGTKDMTTCIRQKLSKAGEDTTDDRVCKVAVLASKVAIAAGDTNAEKALNKHYNLAVEAGNALMEVLPESPELMGGLMQKLADAFPMKTCMQGEEFMCIDGMKVTQKTLQTVFGVASYDELQKGMKLKRLPSGETILVYGAKDKNGEDIPIGVVGARQKGKGYEGTVGFEISCSDDFALAVAEANKKNGDASESNEKARQSIGKRVNNRNSKADKKK